MDAHKVAEHPRRRSTRWRSTLGGLDILVNCIGMNREQQLAEVTEETFDEIYRTNLRSAMFLAQAAARHQIAGGRGGKQVHLLSVRSQLGMRGFGYSAYCATKGALVMLVKQHALELAPHGITVNGIAPTVVLTEAARNWLENPGRWRRCCSRASRWAASPSRATSPARRSSSAQPGLRLRHRPGALPRRRHHRQPVERRRAAKYACRQAATHRQGGHLQDDAASRPRVCQTDFAAQWLAIDSRIANPRPHRSS